MSYRPANVSTRSVGAGRHDSFLARGRPTNPARGILSRSLCAVGIVLLAATAQVSSAGAAGITWAKKGEFETCLESSLDKWLAARAELEVNEHPTAVQLDDAAVATWTLETIAQCRAGGGAAEAASEDRFAKHMAQWRQHIYDLAADIRKKGQSD